MIFKVEGPGLPASNAVRGMSGLCGFAWEKCPGFVGKRFTFPVGTGRMAAWMEIIVSVCYRPVLCRF